MNLKEHYDIGAEHGGILLSSIGSRAVVSVWPWHIHHPTDKEGCWVQFAPAEVMVRVTPAELQQTMALKELAPGHDLYHKAANAVHHFVSCSNLGALEKAQFLKSLRKDIATILKSLEAEQ